MNPHIILPDSILTALLLYLPFLFGTAIFTWAAFLIKWAAYLAWKAIMMVWKGIMTAWKISIDFLLSTIIMPVITWIKAVIVPVWDAITWTANAAWTGLQALGAWIEELWDKVIEPSLNWLYDQIKRIYDALNWLRKEVLEEIAKYYDMTLGKFVEIWAKVKAHLNILIDIIAIFKKEWADWLRDKINWFQEKIITPIEVGYRWLNDRVNRLFDLLTDPLDVALSKIHWLKDLWDNHILILKSLVHPTIEAPQLLAGETAVKTTIIYGDVAADALDGSAWTPPDNTDIVAMEKVMSEGVIDFFAAEVAQETKGAFDEAFNMLDEWIELLTGLRMPKIEPPDWDTLKAIFPQYEKGKLIMKPFIVK